jgi:hypothetical protein
VFADIAVQSQRLRQGGEHPGSNSDDEAKHMTHEVTAR